MNKQKLISYLIIFFSFVAVLYPIWEAGKEVAWTLNASFMPEFFPLLGLAAFTLLWLHSLCGVFETWLQKYINFDRYIHITSILILWCIILHPLLLLISMNFNFNNIFIYYGTTYIWVGIVGWLLLISYDVIKPLKKYHSFFVKHWNTVLIVSNIGFILTFFHSLGMGGDLESGPLRIIWIFYGVTGIISIVYTYAIMPFLKNNSL